MKIALLLVRILGWAVLIPLILPLILLELFLEVIIYAVEGKRYLDNWNSLAVDAYRWAKKK